MISAFALAVSFATAHQDSARTWEFRAARWEQMAPVLSQELGMPVRVNDKIRDEVVIGRFVDKTPEEMVDAFAKSTLTSWSVQGGAMIITSDGRARKAEEKLVRERRVEMFRKNLASMVAPEYTQESLDQTVKEAVEFNRSMEDGGNYDYNTIRRLEAFAPGTRLAHEFLMTLDADDLANAEADRRVVYSSNPTRFQRSMGNFGRSLMAKAQEYQAMRERSLQAASVTESGGGYFHGLLYQPDRSGDLTDVVVSLRIQPFNTQVTLQGLDENGNAVFQGNASVSGMYDMTEVGREVGSGGTPEVPTSPFAEYEKTIEVHPKERSIASFGFMMGARIMPEEDRQNALEMFSKILEEEPLSWTATNALFSLSEQSGLDVSGRVPDEFIGMSMALVRNFENPNAPEKEMPTEIKLSEYLRYFPMFGHSVFEKTDDGYSLKPSNMPTFSVMMNRRIMSFLAQERLKEGAISFDTWADVAAEVDSSQEFTVLVELMTMLSTGFQSGGSYTYGSGVTPDKYQTLRLYGFLPKSVREEAKQGTGTVQIRNLSSEAQTAIFEALTLNQGTMAVKGSRRSDWGTPVDEDAMKLQQSLYNKYGSRISEPTFALATPEASPLVLEVTIGRRSQIVAQSAQQNQSRMTGTVDKIAERMAMSKKAIEQGRTDSYYQPFVGFAPIESDLLSIKVLGGISFESTFECELVNEAMPEMKPLSALPASMQAEFQAAMAKWEERYKRVRFGSSGSSRTVPPPQ